MLARALAGLKQRFHPLDRIRPGGAPGAVSLWILLLILCMVLVVAGRWYAGWFSVNKSGRPMSRDLRYQIPSNRCSDAYMMPGLIWLDAKNGVLEVRYEARDGLFDRDAQEEGHKFVGDPDQYRALMRLLWHSQQGDFIRNEIDSQMTGRVLALRDDRHFDDPEDIDGNRRCADNQHLIHNYLPANCFPNEWSASITQNSGTALPTAKVRPNVAPSQKDFAFIARRGRYYMGDWLEIDPTYAPDNSLYRLTSRVHLGNSLWRSTWSAIP